MIAPFATLVFLLAAWLVVKLLLDMLESDGARIGAALSGHSMIAHPPQSVRPVSARFQPRAGSVLRPLRAPSTLRAAA